jgi:DNA ligase-1
MSSDKVMLAHSYDEKKHKNITEKWWVSEKFDGVRGLWNGKNMISRNGNIYTIPDFFKDQLKQLVDENNKPVKLDGEIWFGYDTFAICSGAARRQINDPEIWKNVKFIVFDIQDTILPFEQRQEKIKFILGRLNIPNIKYIKFKKTDMNPEIIYKELGRVEKKGGEGLMLRKPGSMYVFKRSNDMLKVKTWNYKEAEVICYVEGSGRLSGKVGSLLVKTNEVSEDGSYTTFRVGTGLNDYQRFSGTLDKEWKLKETQNLINSNRIKMMKESNVSEDNKKERARLIGVIKTGNLKDKRESLHELNKLYQTVPTIGSIITFKYKELTSAGIPSFPTFVGVRDYE